jgi:hypothetical protein
VTLTSRATVAGFPVPLLSTTTMLVIPPKVELGSSAVGAVSSCCCSVVCWLVVPLDLACSSTAWLLPQLMAVGCQWGAPRLL